MTGDLRHWTGARPPAREAISGGHVRLEPLDPDRHGADLYNAGHDTRDPTLWDYLPYGPFTGDEPAFTAWLRDRAAEDDPLFFAIVDQATGGALGMVSYLRVTPEHGVIEIGHIWFGAALQRTPAATETIYLLARHAFDVLGNRRLEWKCNAANDRSTGAARRFGFTYEGTFRQMQVVKGANRDTAWFSIIDAEWPAIKAAYERWLDPANFDVEGAQRSRLEARRNPAT